MEKSLSNSTAMTESTLACPHCHGAIRIDSAHAGAQASCPLCQGVFLVPEFDSAPPASTPSPTAPTQQSVQHQFACPLCQSAFLVDEAAFGQSVQCPGCEGVIALPDRESEPSPPNSSAPPPITATTTEHSREPTDPEGERSISAPNTADRTTQNQDISQSPAKPKAIASTTKADSTKADSTATRKTTADRDRSDATKNQPVASSKLRPKQGDVAGQSSLAQAKPDKESTSLQKPAPNLVDHYLPPKFDSQLPEKGTSPHLAEPPNGATPRPGGNQSIAVVDESQYVTVTIDGKEHRLRNLSSEEVAHRKLIRNIVMFATGGILLATLAALLVR